MSESTLQAPSAIVAKLTQTQPWIRFIAILMLIGTVIMVIAGIVMMLIGILQLGQVAAPVPGPGPSGATLLGMGIAYLVLSLIYLFPALFLLRTASSIRGLAPDAGEQAVAETLEHQRRFWKFVGITAIVMLVLYLLLFVGVFLFAFLKAASQHAAR